MDEQISSVFSEKLVHESDCFYCFKTVEKHQNGSKKNYDRAISSQYIGAFYTLQDFVQQITAFFDDKSNQYWDEGKGTLTITQIIGDWIFSELFSSTRLSWQLILAINSHPIRKATAFFLEPRKLAHKLSSYSQDPIDMLLQIADMDSETKNTALQTNSCLVFVIDNYCWKGKEEALVGFFQKVVACSGKHIRLIWLGKEVVHIEPLLFKNVTYTSYELIPLEEHQESHLAHSIARRLLHSFEHKDHSHFHQITESFHQAVSKLLDILKRLQWSIEPHFLESTLEIIFQSVTKHHLNKSLPKSKQSKNDVFDYNFENMHIWQFFDVILEIQIRLRTPHNDHPQLDMSKWKLLFASMGYVYHVFNSNQVLAVSTLQKFLTEHLRLIIGDKLASKFGDSFVDLVLESFLKLPLVKFLPSQTEITIPFLFSSFLAAHLISESSVCGAIVDSLGKKWRPPHVAHFCWTNPVVLTDFSWNKIIYFLGALYGPTPLAERILQISSVPQAATSSRFGQFQITSVDKYIAAAKEHGCFDLQDIGQIRLTHLLRSAVSYSNWSDDVYNTKWISLLEEFPIGLIQLEAIPLAEIIGLPVAAKLVPKLFGLLHKQPALFAPISEILVKFHSVFKISGASEIGRLLKTDDKNARLRKFGLKFLQLSLNQGDDLDVKIRYLPDIVSILLDFEVEMDIRLEALQVINIILQKLFKKFPHLSRLFDSPITFQHFQNINTIKPVLSMFQGSTEKSKPSENSDHEASLVAVALCWVYSLNSPIRKEEIQKEEISPEHFDRLEVCKGWWKLLGWIHEASQKVQVTFPIGNPHTPRSILDVIQKTPQLQVIISVLSDLIGDLPPSVQNVLPELSQYLQHCSTNFLKKVAVLFLEKIPSDKHQPVMASLHSNLVTSTSLTESSPETSFACSAALEVMSPRLLISFSRDHKDTTSMLVHIISSHLRKLANGSSLSFMEYQQRVQVLLKVLQFYTNTYKQIEATQCAVVPWKLLLMLAEVSQEMLDWILAESSIFFSTKLELTAADLDLLVHSSNFVVHKFLENSACIELLNTTVQNHAREFTENYLPKWLDVLTHQSATLCTLSEEIYDAAYDQSYKRDAILTLIEFLSWRFLETFVERSLYKLTSTEPNNHFRSTILSIFSSVLRRVPSERSQDMIPKAWSCIESIPLKFWMVVVNNWLLVKPLQDFVSSTKRDNFISRFTQLLDAPKDIETMEYALGLFLDHRKFVLGLMGNVALSKLVNLCFHYHQAIRDLSWKIVKSTFRENHGNVPELFQQQIMNQQQDWNTKPFFVKEYLIKFLRLLRMEHPLILTFIQDENPCVKKVAISAWQTHLTKDNEINWNLANSVVFELVLLSSHKNASLREISLESLRQVLYLHPSLSETQKQNMLELFWERFCGDKSVKVTVITFNVLMDFDIGNNEQSLEKYDEILFGVMNNEDNLVAVHKTFKIILQLMKRKQKTPQTHLQLIALKLIPRLDPVALGQVKKKLAAALSMTTDDTTKNIHKNFSAAFLNSYCDQLFDIMNRDEDEVLIRKLFFPLQQVLSHYQQSEPSSSIDPIVTRITKKVVDMLKDPQASVRKEALTVLSTIQDNKLQELVTQSIKAAETSAKNMGLLKLFRVLDYEWRKVVILD